MPRGSAPGERRGGRVKGTPNRTGADVRALAAPYGAPAVAELARLAGLTDAPGAANEATRVIALRELLDRAFGKPSQHFTTERESSIVALHLVAAKAVSAELNSELACAPLIEGQAARPNGQLPGLIAPALE